MDYPALATRCADDMELASSSVDLLGLTGAKARAFHERMSDGASMDLQIAMENAMDNREIVHAPQLAMHGGMRRDQAN